MLDERVIENAAPRYRPTSRVLVLDPTNRLLLLQVEDPKLEIPRLWITPGGGVEPGETFEAGARRELWEETGIEAPLGPCVWSRRRVVHYDGIAYDFDERFFVVRVEAASVSTTNVTEIERVVLTAHRWWTVDELAQTDDVLAPRKLASLVGPILTGTLPTKPLILRDL